MCNRRLGEDAMRQPPAGREMAAAAEVVAAGRETRGSPIEEAGQVTATFGAPHVAPPAAVDRERIEVEAVLTRQHRLK
jgi:hypothetical protein